MTDLVHRLENTPGKVHPLLVEAAERITALSVNSRRSALERIRSSTPCA